jgi:WD40 repeat protein
VGVSGAALFPAGWNGWPIKGHKVRVTRAAFNPKGSVLATLDDQSVIRIRDLTFPEGEGDEVARHTGKIHDIQFAENGNKLAAAGDDGIFVWAVPNPNR